MYAASIRAAVASSLLVAFAGASLLAGPNRINSIERFGLGGYIQPVGLHHGFHIEVVAPDSVAQVCKFRPHDIIVKVDGDAIRNLDHLRAVFAEAFVDGGAVTITYTRGSSLDHRVIRCNLKKVDAKAAKDREADPDAENR